MKWSERRLHSELAKPDRVLHSNGSLMAAHMLVKQAQWNIWGHWGIIPTFWQTIFQSEGQITPTNTLFQRSVPEGATL